MREPQIKVFVGVVSRPVESCAVSWGLNRSGFFGGSGDTPNGSLRYAGDLCRLLNPWSPVRYGDGPTLLS